MNKKPRPTIPTPLPKPLPIQHDLITGDVELILLIRNVFPCFYTKLLANPPSTAKNRIANEWTYVWDWFLHRLGRYRGDLMRPRWRIYAFWPLRVVVVGVRLWLSRGKKSWREEIFKLYLETLGKIRQGMGTTKTPHMCKDPSIEYTVVGVRDWDIGVLSFSKRHPITRNVPGSSRICGTLKISYVLLTQWGVFSGLGTLFAEFRDPRYPHTTTLCTCHKSTCFCSTKSSKYTPSEIGS